MYKPVHEGLRYDLIFDLGAKLVRVQCKWAARRGDVLAAQWRSVRRSRDGFVRRPHTADEVDAIAAYCADLGQCYYLPIEQFPRRSYLQLRLAPTRNNQQRRINWAKSFEFEATLRDAARLGP